MNELKKVNVKGDPMNTESVIIPTKDTPQPHNDKKVLLEAMKYRYATKKFDPNKKFPMKISRPSWKRPACLLLPSACSPGKSW